MKGEGESFLWPLITQLVTFLYTFKADEPRKCVCSPSEEWWNARVPSDISCRAGNA